jgi:hypothetical protein
MIFGKTRHQEFLDNKAWMESMEGKHIKFAWFPTILKDGRMVWLQEYTTEYEMIQSPLASKLILVVSDKYV